MPSLGDRFLGHPINDCQREYQTGRRTADVFKVNFNVQGKFEFRVQVLTDLISTLLPLGHRHRKGLLITISPNPHFHRLTVGLLDGIDQLSMPVISVPLTLKISSSGSKMSAAGEPSVKSKANKRCWYSMSRCSNAAATAQD